MTHLHPKKSFLCPTIKFVATAALIGIAGALFVHYRQKNSADQKWRGSDESSPAWGGQTEPQTIPSEPVSFLFAATFKNKDICQHLNDPVTLFENVINYWIGKPEDWNKKLQDIPLTPLNETTLQNIDKEAILIVTYETKSKKTHIESFLGIRDALRHGEILQTAYYEFPETSKINQFFADFK